jgi:hypothetical protein
MEEKPTSSVSIRRTGYVGAPATLGSKVILPQQLEKERKTLDDGDIPASTGTLAVSQSGRVGLKEGAVVAGGK